MAIARVSAMYTGPPTHSHDSATGRNVGVILALVFLILTLTSAKSCSKERITQPVGRYPGEFHATDVSLDQMARNAHQRSFIWLSRIGSTSKIPEKLCQCWVFNLQQLVRKRQHRLVARDSAVRCSGKLSELESFTEDLPARIFPHYHPANFSIF